MQIKDKKWHLKKSIIPVSQLENSVLFNLEHIH